MCISKCWNVHYFRGFCAKLICMHLLFSNHFDKGGSHELSTLSPSILTPPPPCCLSSLSFSPSVQVRRPAWKLWFVSEGRPAVWMRLVQRREPLHTQTTLSLPREPVAGAQRHQQQVHPPKDHTGGTHTHTRTLIKVSTMQTYFTHKHIGGSSNATKPQQLFNLSALV